MQFVRILRFVMALRTLSRLCWCHGWSSFHSLDKSPTLSNMKQLGMSKTYLERFTSELGTALTAISFCNVSDLGHRFHHELIEISKVIESSTILWFESPGPPGPHQAMLGGQDAGHIHRLHSEIVDVGAFALASHCVSKPG